MELGLLLHGFGVIIACHTRDILRPVKSGVGVQTFSDGHVESVIHPRDYIPFDVIF